MSPLLWLGGALALLALLWWRSRRRTDWPRDDMGMPRHIHYGRKRKEGKK